MAKRQKVKRFSVKAWDNSHYRQTDEYTRAVDVLFDRATAEISKAASRGKYDPDKPFSFEDYPSVQSVMQKVITGLANKVTTVIESGSKKQWLFACAKNDGFIDSIMDTSKISKARLKKMQDRNLDALHDFQARKIEGMNLSQRVWKYTKQYKDQIEVALDVGLGEGRSAQQLARDVKQNLKYPDKLFRRVRDKRGNLVLSRRAAAFHPGQGVYRSSVKNAQRLTRSEINMAYRESDYLRWQQLDFVVGFEVKRSNHEPLCKCDVCAKLVGRYPKPFKFKGWHPQCMCYAVPILMDEDEFDNNELGDLKAALRGTTYKKQSSRNAVPDVPKGFQDWIDAHKEAQKNWSSTPYFIRDNFVDGDLGKGLKPLFPIQHTPKPEPTPQIDPIIERLHNGVSSIDDVEEILNIMNVKMGGALLPKGSGKFNLKMKPQSNIPVAGEADGFGNIFIGGSDNVVSAFKKISQGKGNEITEHEIRDLSTLWHEMMHTRAKDCGTLQSLSVRQTEFMEMANEWVSRKTFPDFMKRLGLNTIPHKDLLDDDQTNGYNTMVTGLDRCIKGFGLDESKVLESLQESLLNGSYKKMQKAIGEAVIAGGLKSVDGKKIPQRTLDDFVDQMKRGVHPSWIDSIAKKFGIKGTIETDPVQLELDALAPQIQAIKARATEYGTQTMALDNYVTKKDVANVKRQLTSLKSSFDELDARFKAFTDDLDLTIQEARKSNVPVDGVLSGTITKRDWYGKDVIFENAVAKLKKAIEDADTTSDKPHKAVKQSYTTNEEVNETFRVINSEFDSEPWFEHGDLNLQVERNPWNNGSTNMRGKIMLTSSRLEYVRSALGKIGQKKSADITFQEADAMATFWHEITHNRNKPGNIGITTNQTRAMELANEFVARHSLAEFYGKLGVKVLPHPEFQTTRGSTGYNRRVCNYQHVIKVLNLDEAVVLKKVREHLFNDWYYDQQKGLEDALIAGGLKKANGKKATKIATLMKMIRDDYSEETIDKWLKDNGYL